jgi:hypothetical protein
VFLWILFIVYSEVDVRSGSNDEMEITGRFTVPASAGGVILGRGGTVIRDIAEQSSAKISMTTKEEALFTQERIVTVAGTVSQCIKCTDLVLDRLCDQEVLPTFVNRGTSYSSQMSHPIMDSTSRHRFQGESVLSHNLPSHHCLFSLVFGLHIVYSSWWSRRRSGGGHHWGRRHDHHHRNS